MINPMIELNARTNRNGNTPETFKARARDLQKAAIALQEALRAVAGECCHGRNYQTVENGEAARNADIETLSTLLNAAKATENLALGLYLNSGLNA